MGDTQSSQKNDCECSEMLPPKKNQAVRDEHRDMMDDEEKQKKKEDLNQKDETEEEGEEKYVNVFEQTVVEGKRKHHVDKHEEALNDWIDTNFEEKEGKKCAMSQCYDHYLKLCIANQLNNALAEFEFARVLKKQFPNGFGLKEDSALKGDIREQKQSVPKVKADTLKLKLKDVIHQGFDGLSNPVDGVMFNTLKKHLISKFPALQLDIRPHTLLRGLDMGVYHGYIELLRGVGKAGKYRWYDPEKHEKEEQEMKDKKKKNKKGDKTEGDKTEGEDGGVTGESADEGGEKKDDDKKDTEDETSKDDDDKTKTKTTKKTATKKRKTKPKKKVNFKTIVHSAPQRVEDTFPLALTFMAEPKEATYHRIMSYIERFYDVDLKPERLQKVMETGNDKGYWELIRGSGRSAVYQLTVDSFDPTDDDDLIGKVVNAIMASVEPKTCSARALKEYVTDFHPDFKVADRPNKFKNALERATEKRLLVRLSGIGATGTFQLGESFIPSPVILAGKDSASDYEGSDSSEDDDEGTGFNPTDIDISQFLDAYKPRPTKRRGKVREVTKSGAFDKNAAYTAALVKQQEKSARQGQKRSRSKSALKVPKKKARVDSDSSSDDDEEEEESSSDEVDSTYGSDTAEKYRPRASKSRGGKGRAPPSGKKAPAKKGKKSPPPKKPAAKSKTTKESSPPPVAKKTPRKPPTKRSDPPPSASKKGKAKTPAKAPAKKTAPKRTGKRRR